MPRPSPSTTASTVSCIWRSAPSTIPRSGPPMWSRPTRVRSSTTSRSWASALTRMEARRRWSGRTSTAVRQDVPSWARRSLWRTRAFTALTAGHTGRTPTGSAHSRFSCRPAPPTTSTWSSTRPTPTCSRLGRHPCSDFPGSMATPLRSAAPPSETSSFQCAGLISRRMRSRAGAADR